MQSSSYAIPATYVGGSAYYDIAVLRVDKSSILKNAATNGTLTAVKVADSDGVAVGSAAIAIGAPGVEDNVAISSIAVTSGIVSVDSEYITMTSVNGVSNVEFRVIRIDTAVNSGNSGGGLFNAKGELVGIVNAKITKSDVENIAYAIPSSVVKAVTKNIIDYCYGKECKRVMRAMMGVSVSASKLYTELDKQTGYVKLCEDITVVSTTEGSLSQGALLPNDIIKNVRIGELNVEVKRMHHLIDAMLYARVGDEVITTVIRNGQELQVKIIITKEALNEY
jgi:serine protease Do